MTKRAISLFLVCIVLPLSAFASEPGLLSLRFATTTSWLEVCLYDLLGTEAKITRISPPGTCPGHFDIQPGVFSALQECDYLFYFDFQASIRERLSQGISGEIRAISIPSPSGMSVPTQYTAVCESIHDILIQHFPEEQESLDNALASLKKRMADLENEIRTLLKDASLTAQKVVASGHQRVFSSWLGFDVIDTFSGGDAASPRRLHSLVKKATKEKADFVIANLQEGSQYGQVLAEQLGIPLVVFSNFPSMEDSQRTFDALVLHNINQLLNAGKSR